LLPFKLQPDIKPLTSKIELILFIFSDQNEKKAGPGLKICNSICKKMLVTEESLLTFKRSVKEALGNWS
jgi:hypothetical protein